MDDLFLTRIMIQHVGQLEQVDIELSKHERKHLILTGKNGSGKTLVLTALREALASDAIHPPPSPKIALEWNTHTLAESAGRSNHFSVVAHHARNRLQSEHFDALTPTIPTLELMLRHLFQDHTLQLQYSPAARMFSFQAHHPPIDLAAVSDGYATIVSLLSALLVRIAPIPTAKDEAQGIALIDGIETFLDADLQKRILPFLIEEFPKFQFIVTTHARLVMNSCEQAVIFDLDRQHRIDHRLTYPYEAIIEQYDLSQHSDQIKQMLGEYEQLLSKKLKTEDEEFRILELGGYLAWIIHKFQKTPKPTGISNEHRT